MNEEQTSVLNDFFFSFFNDAIMQAHVTGHRGFGK